MNAIVAVDKNNGIGCNNELLFNIRNDLKRFQALTAGKVVVMGRHTFESLPQKKPLEDRINIILTSSQDYNVDGAIIVHTLDELKHALSQYHSDDIFVIGGEKVYELLLPYCDKVYVTEVDTIKNADRHFPINIQRDPEWKIFESGMSLYDHGTGLIYKFVTYERV